ncbi:hypothetical protein [Agromyces humi]|uniref:hypothetical protein n=1 Tax=Agromyces humi TaxID=1766800 RepID=UPI00135BF07D|nr:hypothetical protein [Agromyces humi]
MADQHVPSEAAIVAFPDSEFTHPATILAFRSAFDKGAAHARETAAVQAERFAKQATATSNDLKTAGKHRESDLEFGKSVGAEQVAAIIREEQP